MSGLNKRKTRSSIGKGKTDTKSPAPIDDGADSDSSLKDVAANLTANLPTLRPIDLDEEEEVVRELPELPPEIPKAADIQEALIKSLATTALQHDKERFPNKPQKNDLAPILQAEANTEPFKFECPKCKKVLRTKHTFNKHMSQHDVDCEVCTHQAKSRNDLTIHYRKNHGEELENKCQLCHGCFALEETLLSHRVWQHKVTNIDRSHSVGHPSDLMEHPFICTNKSCYETFTTNGNWSAHCRVCHIPTKSTSRKRAAPSSASDSLQPAQKVQKSAENVTKAAGSKKEGQDTCENSDDNKSAEKSRKSSGSRKGGKTTSEKSDNKEENGDEMFSCLICGQEFKSHNVMFKHMYHAHDIGSDSGGAESEDEENYDSVIVLDSPSPPRSKPGPASSKLKNKKQNGKSSEQQVSKTITAPGSASDIVRRLLTQDTETRHVLQSVQSAAGNANNSADVIKSHNFEKMVSDILQKKGVRINITAGEKKTSLAQDGGIHVEEDFDSVVANILTEHKDEIKRNIQQQQVNRLQQRCPKVATQSSSGNNSSRSNSNSPVALVVKPGTLSNKNNNKGPASQSVHPSTAPVRISQLGKQGPSKPVVVQNVKAGGFTPGSPLRSILTVQNVVQKASTGPSVKMITDPSAVNSALLGLLSQPMTAVRKLTPVAKPSLGPALQVARQAVQNVTRRPTPVQVRVQSKAVNSGSSPIASSFIAAIASSAAKNAILKFGGSDRPSTPTKTTNQSSSQPKPKGYDKDDDFRSKAKPLANSISSRPKRGKQRRDFSDLLQESESEDDESQSESDSDEYRSKPKVKRRTKAKMTQSDAEDSDCDSQWKFKRKRRKLAVHMRSCVLEWLEKDGKATTPTRDKKLRAASKKQEPTAKEETQETSHGIKTMKKVVEAQVEMVNKLLAHLQKTPGANKGGRDGVSDVVRDTEDECVDETPEEVGLELVYRLFYQCDTDLKHHVAKRVLKHNEWKRQLAVNGEGSDKEMDAYDRSPAFRKVTNRKSKKDRSQTSSPEILHQTISPHKSIMGVMRSPPISPQPMGLKSPISSMSMGNSPAWSTLQILNLQAQQTSPIRRAPALKPAPQIFIHTGGAHNVRKGVARRTGPPPLRAAPTLARKINEVIMIDSSDDDEQADNNGNVKGKREVSPPLFKISQTFSLSPEKARIPVAFGNFGVVQGTSLEDLIESGDATSAVTAVDKYGETKLASTASSMTSSASPMTAPTSLVMSASVTSPVSVVTLNPKRGTKTVPPCPMCGRRFDRMERYEVHLLSHQGIKANPCPFCEKKYARRDALRKHVKQNHPEQFDQLYGSGAPVPMQGKIMDLTLDD